FGFFIFFVDESGSFELYKPFINNLANFVALGLENRLQKNKLQNEKDLLEFKVKERTKELQSLNAILEEEIEERKQTEVLLQEKNEVLRQTNDELRAAHRQFSDIIDFLPDATFVVDKDKKVIAWNRAVEEMTGTRKDEILGKGDYAYSIPWYGERRPILIDLIDTDFKEVQDKYKYIYKQGNTIFAEVYIPSVFEGRGAHLWGKTSLILDDKGKTIGAIESIRDITELKKIEQDLIKAKEKAEENEKLLTDMMDNSSSYIYMVDIDGKFLNLNQALADFLGKPQNEIIGNTREKYMPIEIAAQHLQNDKIVIESRKPHTFEEETITSEGKRIYLTTKFPLIDNQNNLYGIAGISTDITDRKHLEEANYKAQEVFRSLVENSPDIIARYDHNCNRIYVNPVYLKEAQIPQQELIATTPMQRSPLPASSAVILQNLLRKVLDSGIAEAIDVIWPKADTINYWYNVYAFPEFDREANVVSVMTISRDITKRKQAEEQVIKLNRVYAVLSNINQSIVRIHDSKQLFDEVCSIAIEFGKFRMAWIGLMNSTLNKIEVVASAGIIGDYLEKVDIDLNDELRRNGPAGRAFNTEKHSISNNVRNDAEMMPWREDAIKYGYKSVASFPLKVFGKTIGVFLIYSGETDFFDEDDIKLLDETATDISFALESIENETERRRSEENLIKAKEKAEESDRLKTAFLHNISHEIRTPMNAIMGFSELLAQEYNDKQKIENFSTIINQRCEDLLVIINGILDTAKIESGQFPVNIEECDLTKLFVELAMFFNGHQKRIGKQHIIFSLQTSLNPAENRILTDKVKLKQIFINLISNAFKFTDNGKIEGGCKLDKNSKLLFYLSDTGLGIPSDKYNQIFEPFYQIPAIPNRLNEGNGLGLSIVKGFVQLLGGEIWLESELGKGTTFYFSMPYIASKIREDEPLIIEGQQVFNFQNKTILIVEDDIYNAEVIKEMLSNTGLTIMHTVFGNEAVKITKSCSPDLILMDIRLPDINGYEATRKIKEFNPNLKIIAQTAYAAQEDNQKAFKAGCVDYISKPLKRNLLLTTLGRHLK
ncbi:MAG TPA: PAS domain-containing protein, partial [Bacteroidales bacterium]